MSASKKTRKKKTGLPPGSLIYTGNKAHKVEISVIEYDAEDIAERKNENIADCARYKDSKTTAWLDFNGVHDMAVLARTGEIFGLHPLVLEDIANVDQRSKVEIFPEYIFVIAKMFRPSKDGTSIIHEQVSFILGDGYLLSFQEIDGDVFEPVRQRLRQKLGRIREQKADYLLYALLDAIVDSYFVVLESLGDTIEELEDKLLESPDDFIRARLHSMKREMIFLRKSIWPMRETLSGFVRENSALIAESTGIYLRDLYDHIIQVMDTVETQRDMISGLMDIYLTSLSNKMNEVMKVLTIFASIFIPLTFITGVYGMNFKFMPELDWKWGYFTVWGIMIAVCISLLIYFKKKKWL